MKFDDQQAQEQELELPEGELTPEELEALEMLRAQQWADEWDTWVREGH